ncbi:MAG: hypothetical protein RLZZ50_508 [Verrucomicrobiota bacterium]|jgi:hypothetical protein
MSHVSAPAPEPTPNARLVAAQLRPDVVLCCGEDKTAFVGALRAVGLPADPATPDFRGFTAWTFPALTVVLAPIGTGSVEPILNEILTTAPIERIILVGTAGALGPRRLPKGEASPISEAWLAGTGLDREVACQPLRPEWPDLPAGDASASIVSSDFYYGFAPAKAPGDYPHRLPRLRSDFERLSCFVDLVDMEVGQFYALCRLIPERPGLRFLAIKGASNAVENHGEQNDHAPAVLLDCLRQALALLRT